MNMNLRGHSDENRKGVADYLCGNGGDINGWVDHTGNFGYIPCGTTPENPSELLQTGAVDKLMAELKQEYDYIVLDTAPVTTVCDTMLLAKQADMTLMVSCPDTPYEMVERLNDLAEQKRLPNMVGVFNKAE